MPDTPDYSRYLPGSERYALADLGELAARLGSPVTYDRRGEVLWMDACDGGIAAFSPSGSGTGNIVFLTTFFPFHGHYSLEMRAGSDGTRLSQVTKKLSHVSMLRSGLEVAFYLVSANESFGVRLLKFDGTNMIYGDISLFGTTELLCYLDSAGVYQTIVATGGVADPYGIYHHIKIVVDFTTQKYVRALYNDAEYDLSGIALRSEAAADIRQYRIRLRQTGRAGLNDIARLGHVILTGNEP